MSASKIRTIALYAFVVIAAALVAYELGVAGAHWVFNRREQARRAAITADILRQMGGTIAIGKQLPNARLEGLDGTEQDLQGQISSNTIVVFLDAGCQACLDEVKAVGRVFKEDHRRPPVVFISNAGPDELRTLRDQYEIPVPLYHDRDGSYAFSLGVTTYPFNVMVDKTFAVRDVMAGPLSADMVREARVLND